MDMSPKHFPRIRRIAVAPSSAANRSESARRLPHWLWALPTIALLSGCASLSNLFGLDSSSSPDYQTGSARTQPLEVPPDLTQLSRESRFGPQGASVISASAMGRPAVAGSAATQPGVALQTRGEVRVERLGDQRWLVTPLSPDELWPRLRGFWESNGFTIASQNPAAGVMETEWSEQRGRVSPAVARNLLGGLLSRVFDTGERDQFRTRVDRVDGGSEIFITHRGIEEVYATAERDSTRWRPRPNDPSLEADFLARLMVALGQPEAEARTAVAQAPEVAPRARLLEGRPAATLELDEPFDRAWRRVGLALDRSGFSVEDRDRNGGLYYVRYIDPAQAGSDGPNFLARLFGARAPEGPVRYRIVLEGAGEKTLISVQTSAGAPETGEDGQRIVALLVDELRR
jgi:outer membrane protein assembly factor BamC